MVTNSLQQSTRAIALGAILLAMVTNSRSQEQSAQPAPVYTVLYTFTGGADGANPNNTGSGGLGLIRDKEGNLYGTTSNGGDINGYCGANGCGVAFKLDRAGIETVLHAFTGPPDGIAPGAGLIPDPEGNLYGTTLGGGAASLASGTVFKLDRAGHETTLHSFTGGTDGNTPYAGVIRDEAGNLYGTTSGGGTPFGGVVFKLNPAGTETVLYNFCSQPRCTDGASPSSAKLFRDSAGDLKGTTFGGGAHGQGTVFKLDPSTGKETVLYSFTGGSDGGQPFASLVRDRNGNFYSTASAGGYLGGACAGIGPGCGVVFKLDPAGKVTVLHTFTGGADGAIPYGGLLLLGGDLYGTTYAGGNTTSGPCTGFGCGVVFKLDAAGKETVLHTFTGGADGLGPYVGLIADAEDNLYGTTGYGGNLSSTNPSCVPGCGVIFRIKPR